MRTSTLRRLSMERATSPEPCLTWVACSPVRSASSDTAAMRYETSCAAVEVSTTLRLISWVAADCSSIAVATEPAMWSISAMVRPISSTACTA